MNPSLSDLFVKVISLFRKFRKRVSRSFCTHGVSSEEKASGTPFAGERHLNPESLQEAHVRLRKILNPDQPLQQISYEEFMLGWVAMAYIAPGLNPDEAGDEYCGWPSSWKKIAAEAYRRFEKKELTAEEFNQDSGNIKTHLPL